MVDGRTRFRGTAARWWLTGSMAAILALAGCPTDADDDAGDDDAGDDDAGDDDAGDDDALILWSDKFGEGEPIPLEHTCDNQVFDHGVSPHLAWAEPPQGTQFFAITVFDPDAGDTPHWGVFDIPVTTLEFPDGLRPANPFPEGGWEAVVYTGAEEYAGPCPPPPHDPHHYVLTVHALDAPMPQFATTPPLEEMGGLIAERELAAASLIGTYDRP